MGGWPGRQRGCVCRARTGDLRERAGRENRGEHRPALPVGWFVPGSLWGSPGRLLAAGLGVRGLAMVGS